MKEKLLYLDMPVVGKEIERQYTPDELAVREVENYVERVERQTEKYIPDGANTTPQPTPTDTQSTPVKQQSVNGVVMKPNIVLPLSQETMGVGLKENVMTGMRWLAEWCVMMIKKYPGRVFYSPVNQA